MTSQRARERPDSGVKLGIPPMKYTNSVEIRLENVPYENQHSERSRRHGMTSQRANSQSDDLITPRTWSEMIARDSGGLTNGIRQNGTQIKTECEKYTSGGARKRLYAQDVVFHDVESNRPLSPASPTCGGHGATNFEMITPRTWNEMVAEDGALSCLKDESSVAADSRSSSESGDQFAASVEYVWPPDSPRRWDNRTRIINQSEWQKRTSAEERLAWNIKMLKRELKLMRQQDQDILKQFLRNYEIIGQMFDHVTVTPMSSPSRKSSSVTLCSLDSLSSCTDSEGGDLLRIVRDALTQEGHLDIEDIVTRLSPIRRRRTSEPTMDYDDFPSGLDEDEENEFEDHLSISCPAFKEPQKPTPSTIRK